MVFMQINKSCWPTSFCNQLEFFQLRELCKQTALNECLLQSIHQARILERSVKQLFTNLVGAIISMEIIFILKLCENFTNINKHMKDLNMSNLILE